jgi:hypothetical protein
LSCRSRKGATPSYQWERNDGTNWKIIPGADNVEFTPTEQERGLLLRCAVTAVSRDGLRSSVLLCGTEVPVAESFKINVEGGVPFTGTVLTTNRHGALTWQRSGPGGTWSDVGTGKRFLVTAVDVGFKLRAVERECISEPTKVVELTPVVKPHVIATVKAGKFNFRAVGTLGGSWNVICRRGELEMKSNGGNVKIAKWTNVKCDCGEPGELFLSLDAGSRFPLVPSLTDDPRVEALIGAENVRDFVVAVIRGFVQRAQASGSN